MSRHGTAAGSEPHPNLVRPVRPEAGDAFPVEIYCALKSAFHRLVTAAGGVEPVAALFGTHKARVSELHSPNYAAFPSLRQVANLEAFVGRDDVSQAMAALHGADLVRRPTAGAVGLDVGSLGRFVREAGEAMQAAADAMRDGQITAPEAIATRAELLQVVRCATELIAGLDQRMQEAGDAA